MSLHLYISGLAPLGSLSAIIGREDKMALTPKQAEQVLLYAPYGSCVVLVGQPGCAKSAVNYRAAVRAGAVYEGKYTADQDVLDGKGIPHLKEGSEGKMLMSYAPLGTWPTVAAKALYPATGEIRVNLDDWGQSPGPVKRQMARAIYGDGVERYLGDSQILPNVLFSATSNRVEDKAGVTLMESYAQNRIVQVNVEPDVDEWVSGAIAGFPKPTPDSDYPQLRAKIEANVKLGIPDEVIAYAKWNKSVSSFEPGRSGPFMSQRSLTELGKFMRAFEAVGLNGECFQEVAAGTLGEAEAVKFIAFHKLREHLPDIEAILRGEDVELPTQTEILFICCTTLLRAAKAKHLPAILKFIHDVAAIEKDGRLVGVEVSVYMARECTQSKELKGIVNNREFITWITKNGKFVL